MTKKAASPRQRPSIRPPEQPAQSTLIPMADVLRERIQLQVRLEEAERQRQDLSDRLASAEKENKELIQRFGQLEGEIKVLRQLLASNGIKLD